MMTMRLAAALAATLSLAAPALADSYVKCGSGGYRYTYCPVDTRYGVELAEQESSTPCTLNSTWGYDPGGIWADAGCRGIFRILEGRTTPQRYDEPEDVSNVDAILADLESDGTMDELRADDELQGRQVGFGAADAVEACAEAADIRESERGARSVIFESIDDVVPRARRSFDVEITLIIDHPRRGLRRFDGQCRVQNGRVTSFSRS